MQVGRLCVWVTFHFRHPQQIVGSDISLLLYFAILPHFQERGNIRFLGRISYLLDIRESGLFSATILLSNSFRQNGGSAEGGKPFAQGSRGMQSPWAESRGGSLWSVSRGETFGPGAGRQRLLGVQRAKPFGSGAG